MAARAGMADLISELRIMTDAGTADYTSPATLFTDDQLQSILDQERTDFYMQPLRAQMTYVTGGSGSVTYFDYYHNYSHVEGTATGAGTTTAWRVTDSLGSVILPTAYSVNMDAMLIQFSADTLGSARYLTGRAFDIHRAAGQVWRRRAAAVWDNVDWSSDNHRVSAEQKYKHCIQMAQTFERAGAARTITLIRSDAN